MYEEKQIKELAKELCKKSCHHLCQDTTDCIVEDEAKEVIANSATTTEKQIEEITKVLNEKQDGGWKFVDGSGFTTDVFNDEVANALYNAGYRKQGDVIDEFAEKLKEAPIKCGLPLFGLSTKEEIEEYFNDIMLQVRDAIDNIAKEMKGGE